MAVFRRHVLTAPAAAMLACRACVRLRRDHPGRPAKTFWLATDAETGVRQGLSDKEDISAELTIHRSGAEAFEGRAAGAPN